MPSRKKQASPEQASPDDVQDSPPTDIDPYETLHLESSATPDDVKKAYRKLALQHHPDKAPADKADEAKQAFQRIAFAYAVLSDPRRRARYDATGSTAESLLDGADGSPFDWLDFYRAAYTESVTDDKLKAFAAAYRGSADESADILAAYARGRGSMDAVYEHVMLSNVLDDDARLRAVIDAAIAAGTATAHPAYTQETAASKERRVKRAERERAAAAKESAKLAQKKKEKKKSAKDGDGEGDLLALIQSRAAGRDAGGFLAGLEAKYAGGGGGGGTRKKRGGGGGPPDEPPEEAFAAVGARAKKARKGA